MSDYAAEFKKRIEEKNVNVAVVGLGYVGLPLAIEFAKKGLQVFGIEIDKDRLEYIKKRESYITDISHEELREVLDSGKFKAVGDFTILQESDVIIICVPTPLKKKYSPDISYIKGAVKGISKYIKKGSLVILESTTYPGTTDEVILPLLEKNDFKHNKDFYLSFSPERIDPGNKDYPVNKIPKVVGGISPEATTLAQAVYQNIIERIVPVSSSRVAEAVKLLENTFRLINIGLIEELSMMCHKMDIDIWEVIDAAKTKPFGFMPFYPGPGVGGHCIPKDPLYLFWKAKHHGFRCKFIKLASDVISYMPEYVVERAIQAIGKAVKKPKVLVVGVTYKKDVKDLRKSPPIDIIDVCQKKKINVSYYDPLIPYLKYNQINLKSIELNADKFGEFDCVIIATDHTCLDYNFILNNSRLIFDTRNVYKDIYNIKVVKL